MTVNMYLSFWRWTTQKVMRNFNNIFRKWWWWASEQVVKLWWCSSFWGNFDLWADLNGIFKGKKKSSIVREHLTPHKTKDCVFRASFAKVIRLGMGAPRWERLKRKQEGVFDEDGGSFTPGRSLGVTFPFYKCALDVYTGVCMHMSCV